MFDIKTWTLGGEDIRSIGKGLLIAVIGAVLTYLTEYFTKANFGIYTPLVVAIWSTVANTIRKILDGEVN